MSLETGTYIGDLVATNPPASDPKSQGDDHLRLIKAVLLNSLAGFAGPVLVTGSEAQGATVNDYVVTVSPAPAAYVAGMLIIAKAAHTNTGAATLAINALGAKTLAAIDGTALAAADLAHGGTLLAFYDGTQFLSIAGAYVNKTTRAADLAALAATYAPLASPAFTGVPTAPTAALGTASAQLATTAFVLGTAFSSVVMPASDIALFNAGVI